MILGTTAAAAVGSFPGCPAQDVSSYPFDMLPSLALNGADYVACDVKNIGYKVRLGFDMLLKPNVPFDGSWPALKMRAIVDDPQAFVASRTPHVEIATLTDPGCTTEVGGFFLEDRPDTFRVCRGAADSSTLTMAGLLVHEARHRDGPPHVRCDRGHYRNVDFKACDKNLAGQGSYVAEISFYLGVMHDQQFSTSLTREARGNAIQRLIYNVNDPGLELTTGLALQRRTGEVDFFDGAHLIPMMPKVDPNLALQPTSGFIELWNSQRQQVARYLYGPEPGTPDLGLAEPDPKGHVIAFGANAVTSCFATEKDVTCRNLQTGLRMLYEPTGWTINDVRVYDRAWFHSDQTSKQTIYVIINRGDDWGALPVHDDFSFVEKKNVIVDNDGPASRVNMQFRDVVEPPAGFNLKGRVLGVLEESPYTLVSLPKEQLTNLFKPGNAKAWTPVPGTAGIAFSRVAGTILWSRALEKL